MIFDPLLVPFELMEVVIHQKTSWVDSKIHLAAYHGVEKHPRFVLRPYDFLNLSCSITLYSLYYSILYSR